MGPANGVMGEKVSVQRAVQDFPLGERTRDTVDSCGHLPSGMTTDPPPMGPPHPGQRQGRCPEPWCGLFLHGSLFHVPCVVTLHVSNCH